jgi:ABC-type cobalt transport system substrate-binding protein
MPPTLIAIIVVSIVLVLALTTLLVRRDPDFTGSDEEANPKNGAAGRGDDSNVL